MAYIVIQLQDPANMWTVDDNLKLRDDVYYWLKHEKFSTKDTVIKFSTDSDFWEENWRNAS